GDDHPEPRDDGADEPRQQHEARQAAGRAAAGGPPARAAEALRLPPLDPEQPYPPTRPGQPGLVFQMVCAAARRRLATPVDSAAAATAVATSGATSRLKTLGITYSGDSSSGLTTAAIASAAASFISSLIDEARTSSAPRKMPGNARTLLIWFG